MTLSKEEKRKKTAAARQARYIERKAETLAQMDDDEWFRAQNFLCPGYLSSDQKAETPAEAETALRPWCQALQISIDVPVLLAVLAGRAYAKWLMRGAGPLQLQPGKPPRIHREPNYNPKDAAKIYPEWPLPTGSESYLVTPDVQSPAAVAEAPVYEWKDPGPGGDATPEGFRVPDDPTIKASWDKQRELEENQARQRELERELELLRKKNPNPDFDPGIEL